LTRLPWGPVYGARYCYGSLYTTAHGRTLRRRISPGPNRGHGWQTQSASVVTRHHSGRSAMRAAARRECAYDFLSPGILRNEGMRRSKGSRLKGWIESSNALRWRLDQYYAAPLLRQSRENSRTLEERRNVRFGSNSGQTRARLDCPLCAVISTGRRNTGGQLAKSNDDGLPNARPIVFSESLRNQLSHNTIFSAAFVPSRNLQLIGL
jgi:hypothetical protein